MPPRSGRSRRAHEGSAARPPHPARAARVEIVRELQAEAESELLFGGAHDPDRPLGKREAQKVLLRLLKAIGHDQHAVVHGSRASFKTWAHEARRSLPDRGDRGGAGPPDQGQRPAGLSEFRLRRPPASSSCWTGKTSAAGLNPTMWSSCGGPDARADRRRGRRVGRAVSRRLPPAAQPDCSNNGGTRPQRCGGRSATKSDRPGARRKSRALSF